MKKILIGIVLILAALSLTGQTTIIDYTELWTKKESQIRLEVAIHTAASVILSTPADSTYAAKAVAVMLSSNLSNYKRRYTREAINRGVNPEILNDTQLINGIRELFIDEYWAEQLRDGEISATQYYIETQ